jgi:crotonobetainyl-CoA:carnitine CoA-transferase CaiB-like acyl-CoA transferase
MENETMLAPYRVLDLTEGGCMISGKILADLGADVIKIEPPGGSPSRKIGPFYKDDPHPEKSIFWFAYNTNKRGITLDIKTMEGHELFSKLVKTADIVLENFQPGYLSELGLDYESLCEIKPDIILTSISAFGQTGPKALYKASELTSWASGGTLYTMGDPDRPPTWISFPQAFLHGGNVGAAGSLFALWHRIMTGEGQHVDVSIQQYLIWITMFTVGLWDCYQYDLPRGGYGWNVLGLVGKLGYEAKDGWVTLLFGGGAAASMRESSKGLVKWMDEENVCPEWLKNLDWMTEYDMFNEPLVIKVRNEISKFISNKTIAELYEEAKKRNILLAPVATVKNILESEQLRARKYWTKVFHPELEDSLTYCGPFAKCSKAPVCIKKRAPLTGEHNDEIYIKELGIPKETLVRFYKLCIL